MRIVIKMYGLSGHPYLMPAESLPEAVWSKPYTSTVRDSNP